MPPPSAPVLESAGGSTDSAGVAVVMSPAASIADAGARRTGDPGPHAGRRRPCAKCRLACVPRWCMSWIWPM